MYGLMAGDPSNPLAVSPTADARGPALLVVSSMRTDLPPPLCLRQRRLSAGAALRDRSEHLDAGLGKVIADRKAGGAEAVKEKPQEKRNASQSPPDKRGPKARAKGGGQRNGGRKAGRASFKLAYLHTTCA